ncbi:hypothetical protein GR160_08580 [Flavobacterium sp. Sd200]|uniref:hypothetical protein n=1 Tax=Flavobacterium sp. Sd200 TaxID=2692211 RepID=UPI00137193AD|nr:hypothetical protein [Flavobacterium sp. Sd200]MXN91283.1 hypothetical protein [Flavobacterium sp. Sd200]
MNEALPASAIHKTARKTYSDAYPAQATKLCLLGATDADVASYFSISITTLNKWKKNHPEFAEALQRGKKAADIEVAVSLYSATIDRIVTVKQAIKCKEIYYDENGKRVEKERIEIVEVEKHIPADFRSQQFWLRNRNPAQWNEKYDDTDDAAPGSITLNLGSGQNPVGDETAG